MAGLHAETERADGAGDENFAGGGFASFAGDFDSAGVEALYFVAETDRREFEAVGAEGVGFDDMRSGFDVGLVHPEDGFGLRGIKLVEAALRTDGLVQHRAHRAVGDQNRILQPLIKVEHLRDASAWKWKFCARLRSPLSAFVP